MCQTRMKQLVRGSTRVLLLRQSDFKSESTKKGKPEKDFFDDETV